MGNIRQLKWWAYKILPLAYDDSLSYYEAMDKCVNKVNELVNTVNDLPSNVSEEIKKQLDGDGDVFNNLFSGLANAIATKESDSVTFTPNDKDGGEIIWLGDTLYEVVAEMAAGTNYIIGTNIVPVDVDSELNKIKNFITANNEYYHERAVANHDSQTYLYWKDKLYRVDTDIKVNDILAERVTTDDVTTGQLTLVNAMDEITAHYIEMHEADNNLQTQIDNNDGDIQKLQNEQVAQSNRIDNIVAQAGSDNTEIIDARTGYNGTVYKSLKSRLDSEEKENFGKPVYVDDSNYSTTFTNANSAEQNVIYLINTNSHRGENDISNIPEYPISTPAYIMTYSRVNNYTAGLQIYISNNGIWRRYGENYLGEQWSNWDKVSISKKELDNTISFYNKNFSNYILPNNYSTNLPDANDVNQNTIYHLLFNSGTTEDNCTKNLPIYPFTHHATLITMASNVTSKTFMQQFYINNLGAWKRESQSYNGSAWTDWEKFANNYEPEIITVGTNGTFNTILDAALYCKAHANRNITVKVYGGTYDIISEFTSKYGGDYFTNMTSGEYGIPIGFGETWLFAPNAILTCNYTGTNQNVWNSFSMFYCQQGGGLYDFSITGLNAKASNIKYIIHDEMTNSNIPYKHVYNNCNLEISQSSEGITWQSTRTIGGGLGHCGVVIIDGCVLASNPLSTYPYTRTVLSYHTCTSTGNYQSRILFKNNIITTNDNINFIEQANGSTGITIVIATNNKLLAGETIFVSKSATDAPNSINLISYNNMIE